MDHDVLRRFHAGDELAVKAVYDRYSGAVYALSMAILRDPGLAADATQQTFLKAWRASSTYEPNRPFAPWIYAIGRRTAIDLYRRERKYAVSDDVDAVFLPDSLETIWEVFEVRSAIDELSDDERQVVRMSHYEGLTHVEIAERLDIPVGTVKSRSHRAHRRLADLLRHLEET